MKRDYTNDLVLRAARGEKTERTPVWLMRQAGRTDPQYNALRQECGMALHDLFRNPELAAEISLLPKRIGVDAIIYFQDILTPLSPMGSHFVFAPGPVLEAPITSPQELDRLHTYDVGEELPFIPETFRLIHQQLDGELPVLGFAGAPLTLAMFVLEGKSPNQKGKRGLSFIVEHPSVLRDYLDRLTSMTIDYLKLQIQAGAVAVQLFESCANLLTPGQYREFALPYQQRIFDALADTVPTIIFAREYPHLDDLESSGAAILSLPAEISIAEARGCLNPLRPLQGNLDNKLLVSGPLDAIEAAARKCVEDGKHEGHIFNLSHGLLRETPFEHVTHLVKFVKDLRV